MELRGNDPDRSDLHLAARRENIGPGVRHVLDFARRMGTEAGICWELELLMEEILANIVQHAYPGRDGDMAVCCTRKVPGGIQVEIRDRGIPFDPLESPRPLLATDLQEMHTDGFGLPLIRHLADAISYRRRDNENRLTVSKTRCRFAHP